MEKRERARERDIIGTVERKYSMRWAMKGNKMQTRKWVVEERVS